MELPAAPASLRAGAAVEALDGWAEFTVEQQIVTETRSDDGERAWLADYLGRSESAMRAFRADPATVPLLSQMGRRTAERLSAGGKLLVCGNGGSAGDAQHIAGEFTSRLMYDRVPMAALALTTDSSALTAIGNDYGFEQIFDRQLRALGRDGDVLLAISTSGRSPNVLRCLGTARAAGMLVLGFTGADGGAMQGDCDLLLRAPSDHTPIIQQIHITAAHMLCAVVERILCPRP